MLGKEVFLVE